MISKYTSGDFDDIVRIIKESDGMNCAWLTKDESIKNDINNAKIVYVYEDGGVVQGFTYMDKLDEEAEYREVNFYLFVHPNYWRYGVTESLWNKLKPYVLEVKPHKASIGFPSHHNELRLLFMNEGFKYSFFSIRLEYEGDKFTDLKLNAREYNDDDFEDYLNIYSNAFYDLRKRHDMRPHLVYTESDYNDEKLRIDILDDSDGLYIFECGKDIVGFGKMCDYLDVVVVDVKKQGKGYGKDIIKQCTNILIDKGNTPVSLYVLDSNVRARRIYKSLGFEVAAVIEVLEINMR